MALVELDRREVLLTPQEEPAPPPPSVWEQWMPTLGSVMAMAMLGAMFNMLKGQR